MTKIYLIREYEEALAAFSTRELAESALELRVRRGAAEGWYGAELQENCEIEWLGEVRHLHVRRGWGMHPVAETIEEVELDRVPWASEKSEESGE